MTFKIGLMHNPKPAARFISMTVPDLGWNRPGIAPDRPVELLIRLREARRRMHRGWKGV